MYLTHRQDPIKCYYCGPEWTREQWLWRVLWMPQISSITETSPSDCLVSYLWHSVGEGLTPPQRWSRCMVLPQPTGPGSLERGSYSSAEAHSMFSIAPGNMTLKLWLDFGVKQILDYLLFLLLLTHIGLNFDFKMCFGKWANHEYLDILRFFVLSFRVFFQKFD